MEFRDEYEYLIHLVKAALRNEVPMEKPPLLSFEKVFYCGVKHEIANIAFYSVQKLRDKPKQDLFEEWELYCNFAVTRDVNQRFARDEILEEFDKHHIRSIEAQGTKVKELYPHPEYRTMSDIDFIVDLGSLGLAKEILQGLGYQCEDVDGVEVDGFREPNIHVEIHTEYFPNTCPYHGVMRPPFSSVDKTGSYDINEFYIYNMLHIAKHYYNRGCGIRRIMDVHCLNAQYEKVVDEEYVKSVFEKAGVKEFVRNVSLLAECWFGEGDSIDETNRMETYLFHAGLHGNMQICMNNRLRKLYGERAYFYRIRYCLGRLFANRETMCIHYPVLERIKVLYPVCWMHRLFRMAHSANRHKIMEEVKAVVSSNLKEY